MTGNKTIFQVDAFSDTPFKGNPAGVMIVDKDTTSGWMQNMALEMNLSETAFLVPQEGSFDIRYFFVVRCFAPRSGINEDPVTGSAHCALTPLWFNKTGKKAMNSYQVSDRSGRLKVRLAKDRVGISGQAVTIFKAELQI
jgi:predicted PhzF superfamily epimerase YddE/YHI9